MAEKKETPTQAEARRASTPVPEAERVKHTRLQYERIGLGQHEVILRWSHPTMGAQELPFLTAPLAVAHAHSSGISNYEIVDA